MPDGWISRPRLRHFRNCWRTLRRDQASAKATALKASTNGCERPPGRPSALRRLLSLKPDAAPFFFPTTNSIEGTHHGLRNCSFPDAHAALTAGRAHLQGSEISPNAMPPAHEPEGPQGSRMPDSADHPDSLGILFALDVTGSMGQIPKCWPSRSCQLS